MQFLIRNPNHLGLDCANWIGDVFSQSESKHDMSIPSNATKEFAEFVNAIGNSKSKQDEDRIIVKEMAYLKKTIMDTKCSDVSERGVVDV